MSLFMDNDNTFAELSQQFQQEELLELVKHLTGNVLDSSLSFK